jgi:transketolase
MSALRLVPFRELHRIRTLPADRGLRAALFATVCRLNALYMIARAGSGHLGSSFSSLDILSWLHLEELESSDRFFSSKGHDVPGLYAVLIGLGRLPFERIHDLRRLGGLPGHPDVGTPGIVTNTGPLGMGISKAKGMVRADRLAERPGRVFVLTGDGELQEGQLWESLASAARDRMAELTVIVDHNKVQSDTLVAAVSDLGDLPAKFEAFGWHCLRCDGHDPAALAAAFARARRATDRPSVIVADTIKGRGVSFMEHTAMAPGERFYRFHSGAPDDASYAAAADELVATANALLASAGGPPRGLEALARPPPPPPGSSPASDPTYTSLVRSVALL